MVSLAELPVSPQVLALLSPKQKQELQSARESVLFQKFTEFEGRELVDSGRFEYEVALKAHAINTGEQQAPAQKNTQTKTKKR